MNLPAILAAPVSAYARLVLLAIAANRGPNGWCVLPVAVLAEKCAADPKTVQRALRDLLAADAIQRDGTRSAGLARWYRVAARFVEVGP